MVFLQPSFRLLDAWMPEQIIQNQCLFWREWEGARSVNKVNIPCSLQRVLEPIMCGSSLWMCSAVQDSVPSGPHLKEGRDLQAEDWTARHWASWMCIIQHSEEADNMIVHNDKTYRVNNNACACINQLMVASKICHIMTTHIWFRITSNVNHSILGVVFW